MADAGDESGQQHQVLPVGLGVTAQAGAVAVRPAVTLAGGHTASERGRGGRGVTILVPG